MTGDTRRSMCASRNTCAHEHTSTVSSRNSKRYCSIAHEGNTLSTPGIYFLGRYAKNPIYGADALHDEPSQEESKKVPIMMRFDRALLQRVDAAAKRRGISRSSWIQFTVRRALDQGEG